VQGYDEPFGIPINAGGLSIFTRNDRRASATGGTVEATVLRTRIVLAHETANRRDKQTTFPFSPEPPVDIWNAEGAETRVQLQRMFGTRIRATVVAMDEAYNGEGRRADLSGVAFRGYDARRAFEADVRASFGSATKVALLGGVIETTHELRDFVVELRSNAITRTPFVGGEVARDFGRLAVSIGASMATTVPVDAIIPSITDRGPTYRRIIAPDLGYQVAEGRAVAGWASGAVALRGSTIVASFRTESSAPTANADHRLQPTGDRKHWTFSLGVRR
jgi:hypothetical protein